MLPGQSLFAKRHDAYRRAFWLGLRESVAPLVAVGTWGFVTGIAMVKSGLTEAMAIWMTILVYAGSAQLAALPLIEAGAPIWLVFAAGTVVNIRFLIFGAALHPYFQHLSLPKRALLGFSISDIGFVLFMTRFDRVKRIGTRQQLWYFAGVSMMCWLVWNVMSIAGVFLGGTIPPSWGLDFAATLALLAIVIPLVKGKPMVACLVVAGSVAWLGQTLPLRLGLAAAVVAGVITGVLAERHVGRVSS